MANNTSLRMDDFRFSKPQPSLPSLRHRLTVLEDLHIIREQCSQTFDVRRRR